MDSYGEILKNARENRNLSFDVISREISIDKKYLEGLEDEDVEIFPGEPYLIGFLNNYAEYLNLDAAYLLKLYHNKQIQESPVPEGLYSRNTKAIVLPIVFSLVALVVIGAIVFACLIFFKKPLEDDSTVLLAGGGYAKKYEITEKKLTSRFYEGDQILIPTDSGQVILTVKDTLASFGLDTPSGVFYTDLSEEAEFDINGDGSSDLIVYVADVSQTDKSRGAEVSFLLRHSIIGAAQGTFVADIPFEDELQSKHQPVVILEDNRAYPFTINATFRASCVFRDKVDYAKSEEAYFSNGEVFNQTAQNRIRVWMSNSNAVKFTIVADSRSYDLPIGNAGQVLVQDIKWIKDSDGRYKLVVLELD